METIKNILKKIGLYESLRNFKRNLKYKKRTKGRYIFENRKKDYSKLCIIIAGYKPFLYEAVFGRIKKYIPKDIDVCVVSSGVYDNKLSDISKENNWSYLSTKKNCVSLVQNIAIKLFKNAQYIYKLDEDIFITENYFEILEKTYYECEKNGDYQVGFVAPTIPINGYGNVNVLRRFNMIQKYTEKFEKPLYAAGRHRKIESDPEAAKFMWGYGGFLPSIDEMNKQMQNDKFSFNACPIRFSIGAILFKRNLWEEMGLFEVRRGSCLGLDELQMCTFCVDISKAIIVSNNSVVGHLSFGSQNEIMKQYFLNNEELFKIN